MMKSTMKRIVLTGAAVAVMMSFAAPAMALPNVVDGGPGVLDPVVDPPPPPPPPPNPLCDVTPFGCGNNPDPVLDPGDNPVAEPPPSPPGNTPTGDTPPGDTPPEDTPPEDTPPPDKDDPGNEESDTSGSAGGSSGGSSGGVFIGTASETVDRGGTFVSSFLPTTLTSTMGEAGNSMKKNLPAPVAKSLPNTGGGWSFLVLVAAGLIAGGFLIRTIVRRTSSVSRTAQ
jgi:LPXTG-motif cell wall-anchored protein